MAPTPEQPGVRYRCAGCGNLTRFDVTVVRRTKEFRHFTVGGDLEIESVEVLDEDVQSVACRWCGATDDRIEVPDAAEPCRALLAGDGDHEAPAAGAVVEIDADHPLPDAEHHLGAGERDRDRRADEPCPDVAVAVRVGIALVVLPPSGLGGDSLEHGVEVGVATRLALDDRHAAGAVRHEHRERPLGDAAVGDRLLGEVGDVDDLAVAPGVERERLVMDRHPGRAYWSRDRPGDPAGWRIRDPNPPGLGIGVGSAYAAAGAGERSSSGESDARASEDTRRRARVGLVATMLLGLVVGLVPTVSGAAQNVVVSPVALTTTPRITDGRVYTIAETGGRIFVGGTFTGAKATGGAIQTRDRILSYSKATGVLDAWSPDFNGDVDSIVPSADGAWLYVGGAFTTVNGVSAKYLVKISAIDPTKIDPVFTTRPNNIVVDMALVGDHLVIGGRFHKVGSATRDLLGSVDLTTGAAQSWLTVGLSEARAINPFVQELDVSPDGHWLVVGGNFMKAGGLDRNQIAVLDLSTPTVTVADWATDRFVGACSTSSRETYIRGVDISPDSTYFVVNTTGAYHGNTTMCDTASALGAAAGAPRDVAATHVGRLHRR